MKTRLRTPYYKIETSEIDLSTATKIIETEHIGWRGDLLDLKGLLDKNHFLQWLYLRHPFRAGIIKMDPFKSYKWHTDTHRGVSVNSLITECPCYTLFSYDYHDGHEQSNFNELRYEINKLYLFNPQIPHTVVNFEQPRRLFTIEFTKDKTQLSYEMLKNEIVNEYRHV